MQKFSSTMKASLRQTSRRKKIRIIFIVGFISLALLLLVPRLVGYTSALVFKPVLSFESWLADSSATIPTYFRDRDELRKEISELERRLAFETVSENTLARLQKENNEFRTLLGNTDESRIAAGVIGRPTVTPYDVLVIDKGSVDGITASAPVYIGSDQVIGMVSAVYEHSAVVTLATTPGVESTVYIYGPNIYTTATGLGGGVLQVSVPQGIVLSPRDLVVLPAFGSGVYGAVSLVESVPTEPEQRGYVTFNTTLQSLHFVSVGTQTLAPLSFEEAKMVVEETRTKLLKVPVPAGVLVDFGLAATTSSSTATSTATSTN